MVPMTRGSEIRRVRSPSDSEDGEGTRRLEAANEEPSSGRFEGAGPGHRDHGGILLSTASSNPSVVEDKKKSRLTPYPGQGEAAALISRT